MFIYTLEDIIVVVIIIFLIVVSLLAALITRVSNWFDRWWKKPAKKEPIDKTSEEYADLFRDSEGNQRDADARAIIKNLANSGFSAAEIREFLDKESKA